MLNGNVFALMEFDDLPVLAVGIFKPDLITVKCRAY